MLFRWDPRKAAANVRKHGVTFEEASTVFGDPLALIFEDAVEEDRAVIVGQSLVQRLLRDGFPRDARGRDSDHQSSRRERSRYEQGE